METSELEPNNTHLFRQRGVTKESKLVHVTSSNVVELSGTARWFFVHSKLDTSQQGRRKERTV